MDVDSKPLGVFGIDASAFSQIDRSFGGAARLEAMLSLKAVVDQLIGDRLGISDLILSGEIGRNEILVLLFRDLKETDFYDQELPSLHGTLTQGLKTRLSRIGYPHLGAPPKFSIGTGAALRNPTISAESQIRHALEQARSDGALSEQSVSLLPAGCGSVHGCPAGWSEISANATRSASKSVIPGR